MAYFDFLLLFSSMQINRTGNQASSAGPRWKIIPSLSKSRSRSRSPVRHMASSEEKRGTASSTIRSTSSVGHEYANSKPTDMGFMEGDSCDDCSTDYKLDQRKPMDPPSHVIQISTYDSMDAEPSQWDNNYEKRIENQSDGTTSYDGEGNTDMYGETPWTSPQYPEKFSPGNQYAEERRESNLRSKLGSTRADFTPSKGSEGAFPDFSTPTTPLTASMTSESSDFPSDFDPFTSKLSHSEQPMYDKASSSFLLFQRPEEYAKQVEATRNIDHLLPAMASKAKSKSAYATMSRLNNPPGLDMDFYAPSKPDAPATTSVASIADKSTNQRFSKVSPTSILDFQNPFVRWSDNLEQLPTPRRETFEQPRSILRNSRTQQAIGTKEEGASDESPCQTETMHVSETKSSMGRLISKYPSSLDFVDEDGHTLSPITSFEAAGGDQDIPAAKNVTSFERNIPEEFQRAVLYKNMVCFFHDANVALLLMSLSLNCFLVHSRLIMDTLLLHTQILSRRLRR